MKSKALNRFLSSSVIALVAFYVFSSLMPLWANLILVALTVFCVLLLTWDIGCSIVLILPIIFITTFVISGIVKIEFFSAMVLIFVIISLVLVSTSDGVLSLSSLIFLGLYFSLTTVHGRIFDLLCFGLLIGFWYANKSKLFNLKVALMYVMATVLVAVGFARVNLFPLKPVLSSIPQPQKQESSEKIQSQEQLIITIKSSDQQESSKKSWLTDFIDKVWFPIVLILFGLLLFTFSVTNFGVKGTLKLLLLGLLIFTVSVSTLSLIFRFIKPSERVSQQLLSLQEGEQQAQESYQVSQEATVLIVEDSRTKKSLTNMQTILDWISVLSLALMSVVLVYSIFKVSERIKLPVRDEQTDFLEDIVVYPLDKIPEYECSERYVLGAYWWLRRKYFPQHHNMTPYEILALTNKDKDLYVISDIYVKVRYAKHTISEQDTELFHEHFLKFIRTIDNSQTG
ncbi:hypothetical protein ACSFC1_01475 [Pseudothermotoga sp. U03pept]|uniref:hypothetical protein n=1 Tax=Pseudothermotoga sp. U03pept TaxID=3447012 RepID=UPI003F0ED2E7